MIEQYINEKFSGSDSRIVNYRKELVRVCNDFVNSGLADSKFLGELTSGNDQKFWSCMSEAFIADRIRNKTFPKRSFIGKGPDFLVMDGDNKVWIEVICPEARNIDEKWTKNHQGVKNFPYNDILLRWTAAIKEKSEKLMGNIDKSIKGYIQAGVVTNSDAYVIAVNGCQLRNGPFSAFIGISQFPIAVEAVFPVGPMQLKIRRETHEVIEQGHHYRLNIINRNKAQVPASIFLDPHYKPISAIWAVDVNGGYVFGSPQPTAVIHNPIASNPIKVGYLPADDEYVATCCSEDMYRLEKVDPNVTDTG